MNPETGRRFGPYEIQSRLGGGGMGHVFRAWDARLHREVAIKLLNHDYVMPGMRERFLREARAASALNHPNICTVFDIGEQDGDPYLVMELLEGETLKDRIQRRTMQLEEIVAIARETAEALGAAHAKGVVHRDIKPANIFLVDKPNGGVQAKVLDFGLAKIEDGVLGSRGRALELTTAGATVGTLAYMSPEQARGEVLDSRSDLFSFGVVMYEMATRHVPFQGATSALVFVQLLNHPPEPVREWNEAIPRELEKIIFKLLSKERTARFQTARELELALIALSERGSGGWLRKAVSSTVPLVRAADPVAREKRLPRSNSSASGRRAAGGTASGPGSRPESGPGSGPDFGAGVGSTSGPASAQRARAEGGTESASDLVLRPVARVPRSESNPTPNPPRRSDGQDAGNARFSPPAYVARSPFVTSPEAISGGAPAKRVPEDARVESAAPLPVISAQAAVAAEHPAAPAGPDAGGWTRRASQQIEEDAIFPGLLDSARRRRSGVRLPAWWPVVGLVVVLLVAAAAYYILNRNRFGAPPLAKGDSLVMTEIENRTGTAGLDGAVATALRLELVQSSYLRIFTGASYLAASRAGLPGSAANAEGRNVLLDRRAAERLGAKAYGFGTLTGSAGAYKLHVEVRDVGTNAQLTSVDGAAENEEQLSATVDDLASTLRANLGEPRASIDSASSTLAHEATARLPALALYAQAEGHLAGGGLAGGGLAGGKPAGVDVAAALHELQQAVELDGHFIQAQVVLGETYRMLHAEAEAADAARHAYAASEGAGDRTRTLTEAYYQMDTTGDYLRATTLLRHLLESYPGDSEGLALLARTLLLEGHMPDALQTAQQAYAEDAYSAAGYRAAEDALVGLDRYDAAYQLDLQAQRLGLATTGESLMVGYLDGRRDAVAELTGKMAAGGDEAGSARSYGLYLDNEGRLRAGAAVWQGQAAALAGDATLRSAAALLLSQGALDRALVSDCKGALALLGGLPKDGPAGQGALFDEGMAQALCGDTVRTEAVLVELQRRFGQSFALRGFQQADLQAALSLRRNQPGAALEALRGARSYDLISLTPYLRGQAHVHMKQVEIGIVDYQTVLSHRGMTFLLGSTAFPAAQVGVARAFASSGDVGNSAEAYRRFLLQWSAGDVASPLIVEAQAHTEL